MSAGRGIVAGILVMTALVACKKSDKEGPASDEVSAVVAKAKAGDPQSCGLDHGKAMGAFGVKAFPALTKAYAAAKTDPERGCILDMADEVVLNNQSNTGVKELGATLACHALSGETKSGVTAPSASLG